MAGRRVRHARPGDRAVDRAADDGRHRPARLGRRRRADVRQAGADRPARPATAGRSRWGSPPTSCSTTPPFSQVVDGTEPRLALPEHAVRRTRAARPGRGDVPARRPHRPRREARMSQAPTWVPVAILFGLLLAGLPRHVARLATPRPQARPAAARAGARRSPTCRRPGSSPGARYFGTRPAVTGSTGSWPAGSARAAAAGSRCPPRGSTWSGWPARSGSRPTALRGGPPRPGHRRQGRAAARRARGHLAARRRTARHRLPAAPSDRRRPQPARG